MSSDEEPSTSAGRRGRKVCGRRGADDAGAAAAGDAPCAHSPQPHAWKTEADPDTATPQIPRFVRSGLQVSSLLSPMAHSHQLTFFLRFLDDEALKLLCENTNKNFKRNLDLGKRFALSQVTPQEMLRYIGLLLFMAVCKLPKIADFWRTKTIFHVPFPSTVMSRDSFRAIASNLHMSDPKDDAINDWRRGTKEYNHPVFTGETVMRWRNEDGVYNRVPIPRPTSVSEYNKHMGGVDTSDQMLGTTSVHRKTKRWPTTVFQHMLDIAVTNSYIIHKELMMTQQQAPMTRQAFQEELCRLLLGGTDSPPSRPPPLRPTFLSLPTGTRRTQGRGRRHPVEGDSVLSVKGALLGCVRSVALDSVCSWIVTVLANSTAPKKFCKICTFTFLLSQKMRTCLFEHVYKENVMKNQIRFLVIIHCFYNL